MAHKYIASLAWPFLHKPGFAMVIEVEWDAQDQNSHYKARVIKEMEEISLPEMFRRCRHLQKEFGIELWYGDAMNEPMISLMVQSGGVIPMGDAPYIGKLDAVTLYLQAIRELTRPDKKVLWFGEGSSLPGHLTNLPKDKPIDISQYPPVAALGYAAAALYLWLQLEYEKKPKTAAQGIIEYCETPQDEQSDDRLPWHGGAEVARYGEDDDEGSLFGYE